MITEPEFEGAWQTGRAAGQEDRPEEIASQGRQEDAPGARRPWLWALGGAVAASAVWAGGLYAFGAWTPALSYRATDNLCEDFRAQALSRMAGDLHRYRPMNQQHDHPALRGAICVLQNGEDVSTFFVRAQVDLHKKTDPAAEFDVPALDPHSPLDADRTQEVPGLGERALVRELRGGAGFRLRVLDGGAVFTVEARAAGGEPQGPAETAALRAAVVQDGRALMAALRKR